MVHGSLLKLMESKTQKQLDSLLYPSFDYMNELVISASKLFIFGLFADSYVMNIKKWALIHGTPCYLGTLLTIF